MEKTTNKQTNKQINKDDVIITREEAFKEINDTQEFYVNELITKLHDEESTYMKSINFTSPTGTGKTNMMALLIKKMQDCFFLITTLSKGQLDNQINDNLNKLCEGYNNFIVYGVCKYTANTKLTADDILNKLPNDGRKLIWLRDEGHIHTNKWAALLETKMDHIVNFSATNKEENGVICNFTNTVMLRTVHQAAGTPEDAIKTLLEVKEQHKEISHYNPCLICRILDEELLQKTIKLCENYNLKYINITTEDFDMSDLCKDDNEYDVIFNKFKIVEGIDIRRAHVLYMDNEPKNVATTIQVIGRCRRNALIYRKDFDIFDPKYVDLFETTRNCYVFYNVMNMSVDSNENGELCNAFCPVVSCQALKSNSIIKVKNGMLPNGLQIIELGESSGTYKVEIDPNTGFNIIKPEGEFYKDEIGNVDNDTYYDKRMRDTFSKQELLDSCPKFNSEKKFNYSTGKEEDYKVDEFFDLKYWVKTIKIKENIQNPTETLIANVLKLIKQKIQQTSVVSFSEYHTTDWKNEIFHSIKNKNFYSMNELTELISAIILKYIQVDSTINLETSISLESLLERLSTRLSETFLKCPKPDDEVTQKEGLNTIYIYFNYLFRKIETSNLYPMYESYTQIRNDRESSIIGVDSFRSIVVPETQSRTWIEDKAVTSKIKKYCKFNNFITKKYSNEIKAAKDCIDNNKLSTKHPDKSIDKLPSKCNSCLGYCVEYYSKYLIYGKSYMYKFLQQALKESMATELNEALIVRACMLKYRDLMIQAYGPNMSKLIKTISVQNLIQDNYKLFVQKVVTLGTKTAKYIKTKMNVPEDLTKNTLSSPILSINHISGLADYIDKNTIIDIKTTPNIDITQVKQVLAYHYLSTKRSDLHINRVIVYNPIIDKAIEVNISKQNDKNANLVLISNNENLNNDNKEDEFLPKQQDYTPSSCSSWEEREDNIVREYYVTEGVEGVQKRLKEKSKKDNLSAPERNLLSIKQRATKLHATKRVWTKEENMKIQNYFQDCNVNNCGLSWDWEDLYQMFPQYSPEEIRVKWCTLEYNANKNGPYSKMYWRCLKEAQRDRIKKVLSENYKSKGLQWCARELGIKIDEAQSWVERLHIGQVIRCVETGAVYQTIEDVWKKEHIKVGLCLQGIHKTASGYHWEYVEEE